MARGDTARQDDDENCEDSERAESAQARGETIARWKPGSRIDPELKNVFRQL